MLHLAGAFFIALKIVEGHTIIEFFPLDSDDTVMRNT